MEKLSRLFELNALGLPIELEKLERGKVYKLDAVIKRLQSIKKIQSVERFMIQLAYDRRFHLTETTISKIK